MSIARYIQDLSSLFGKPHETGPPQPTLDAYRDIINYMRSLFNREDLLEPLLKQYEDSKSLNEPDRAVAFVRLYAAFEEILVNNKPPIVKVEHPTKTSLRDDITARAKIQSLPLLVQVFFLKDQVRRNTLCFIVLHYIAQFISSHLGVQTCRQYIEDLVRGSAIEKLVNKDATGDQSFLQLDPSLFEINEQESRFLWQRIFNGLFTKATVSLGEKLVKEHFEHAYEIIKLTNDYSIISELFEVFPKEITEKDRLQYLSREELENQVVKATSEEKDKRAIIEKLNKDLQEKVEDLHKSNMNILAYEKALEEAKSNVERQVAERTKQLLESQERLFKFLEILPIGVFVFDRQGGPYYVNAALKHLIGNDVRDLEKLDPIKRAYQGESSAARDIEIDRGQKHIQLEVFAAPIFDSMNRVEFVIAAFHDITEEKVLERSKDEFFSIASHELRTPLTAIRGLAWILQQEYTEKVADPEFKTMVNDIYSSSVRLIGLVNDFLNMSRLEQGRMVFKNEPFKMRDLVDEVVKEYTIPAQEKGLYLKGDLAVGFDGPVVADRSKVKEVLINFIGNALKFTKEGGLTVYLSKELETALVQVADTGSGIPKNNQALLFRKFQQAGRDIYAREMSQGSGLGLYISKLMIQGMKGSIGLEKSDEHGSVFFLSLPLANATHTSTIK